MVDYGGKQGKLKEAISKILIIGDSKVGKSSILRRFTDNIFTQHTADTIGIDYKSKTIIIDDKLMKLQIWDTAGQERYRSITQNFYKHTMGVLIVFDLTDEVSFDNVRNWLRQIKAHAEENVCKLLVGNKSDLEANRVIKKEAINALINDIGVEYYEVSAKNNTNVNEAFYCLAKRINLVFFNDFQKRSMLDSANANKSTRLNSMKGISQRINYDDEDSNSHSGKCC